MEVFELLDELRNIIEEGNKLPFTNKRAIEADVLVEVLEEIKAKMPDELKQARWIREERARILQEANMEADEIIKEAENRIIQMIDEHEITRQAYEKREQILDEAKEQSREMSEETRKYVDGILKSAEDRLEELNDKLTESQTVVTSAIKTFKENRKDLN